MYVLIAYLMLPDVMRCGAVVCGLCYICVLLLICAGLFPLCALCCIVMLWWYVVDAGCCCDCCYVAYCLLYDLM